MKKHATITPKIRTAQYVFSHGRQPRGGCSWAFAIGTEIRIWRGSYSVAKELAVALAKAQNVHTIDVLP